MLPVHGDLAARPAALDGKGVITVAAQHDHVAVCAAVLKGQEVVASVAIHGQPAARPRVLNAESVNAAAAIQGQGIAVIPGGLDREAVIAVAAVQDQGLVACAGGQNVKGVVTAAAVEGHLAVGCAGLNGKFVVSSQTIHRHRAVLLWLGASRQDKLIIPAGQVEGQGDTGQVKRVCNKPQAGNAVVGRIGKLNTGGIDAFGKIDVRKGCVQRQCIGACPAVQD